VGYVCLSFLSTHSLNIPVEKRKEDKAKAEAEAAALSDLAQPAQGAAEDAGTGMDVVGTAAAKEQGNAHPPQKKYRLSERMKAIVWKLVSLSNECCRLENEHK